MFDVNLVTFTKLLHYHLDTFQLSIETLKLFESLIYKPCDLILNNLILRNLRGRKYYNANSLLSNGNMVTNGPVAKKETPASLGSKLAPSPLTPPLTPDGLGSPQLDVEDTGREEVEQVVNRYCMK